jgi:hypothetical protein
MKIKENEFLNYFNNRTFDSNMFKQDGSLNKNYNSFKKTGTIAQIFEDHWDTLEPSLALNINKYRPYADKEIRKIIDCHNKNLGCSVYECHSCKDIVFVGHTCKSRLCSSCGYKYKNERVESIMQTAYNCTHRQIVFTIPKELRLYFFENFYLINLLFKAACDTIYSIFNDSFKRNKSGKLVKYTSKIKYTPGFFAFLHTFGRDLKWNVHIHILIAEIKLGSDGSCKTIKHFDFSALRRRFQSILLNLLDKKLNSHKFKKLKNLLFKNYKNGFYVYAESKKFNNLKSGIEYVTRYCGRVPISENRIINYDGENVTFSYIAHEDNSYYEVTVSADEFIALLARHIVPPQFKIIRYYGFYRRKHFIHNKMILLIKKEVRNFRKSLLKHQASILLSFKRDPYFCPKCDTKMSFVLCIN